MFSTDVCVIGAGQAGLATSHHLSLRGIDHVVLDRGDVGERWRSERSESLSLLTPNWQSRLPGHVYSGPKPDGFMSMPEVIALLEGYAIRNAAPIWRHTRVLRVESHAAGYRVSTDRGEIVASNVVIATGFTDVPARPRDAQRLSPRLHQLAPRMYRNPASLPAGGVLVVGASASGAQIADELARAGRDVTLAVGRHTRLPRRYRGADIMWWFERLGVWDETAESLPDPAASRAQPSMQLIGSEPARDLDLRTLLGRGVRLTGRLRDVDLERVKFAPDLASSMQRADRKLERLLSRIDDAAPSGKPFERPEPIAAMCPPAIETLDLATERISTVIWATGYRRDYSWLRVPVLGADRELVHERGITPAAGIYAVGLRFQHTRKSNFIDGVGADAEYVVRDIAERLGVRASVAA
jgi:putative flavoprotein involved in K+ transport